MTMDDKAASLWQNTVQVQVVVRFSLPTNFILLLKFYDRDNVSATIYTQIVDKNGVELPEFDISKTSDYIINKW